MEFCFEYYPGYTIRPIVAKVDHNSIVHIIEFNPTANPGELEFVKAASYRIVLSDTQKRYIAETEARGK